MSHTDSRCTTTHDQQRAAAQQPAPRSRRKGANRSAGGNTKKFIVDPRTNTLFFRCVVLSLFVSSTSSSVAFIASSTSTSLPLIMLPLSRSSTTTRFTASCNVFIGTVTSIQWAGPVCACSCLSRNRSFIKQYSIFLVWCAGFYHYVIVGAS